MLHWLQESHEAHGPYGVEMPKDWSLSVITVTEMTIEQENDRVAERSEENKAVKPRQ